MFLWNSSCSCSLCQGVNLTRGILENNEQFFSLQNSIEIATHNTDKFKEIKRIASIRSKPVRSKKNRYHVHRLVPALFRQKKETFPKPHSRLPNKEYTHFSNNDENPTEVDALF